MGFQDFHAAAAAQGRRTLGWLALFGIAMGYFEAAVVVDLRALFCPGDILFPIRVSVDLLGCIEIGREFFSLVMLAAAAGLAAPSLAAWFANFMILFGIWDIFYYVFLKLLIGWPASLMTWDLLFLIPVPWASPVLAPVLISLLMIGAGIGIWRLAARGSAWRCPAAALAALLAGAILVLWSFWFDWRQLAAGGVPSDYPWGLFAAGFLLMAGAFAACHHTSRRIIGHEPPS